MNRTLTHLVTGALLSLAAAHELRAAEVAEEPGTVLENMVVVASKHPRPLIDVVGAVTVFDAAQISAERVENLDDLLRYEPSLSTDTAGTRFGVTGMNIRGIGDDRVLTEIDGVPLGDGFHVGSFSNAGLDLLDTDLIKRVEVLNGPASTLYGSDALGGVMAITTRDPADLLTLTSADAYFGSRLAWDGEDESRIAAVSTAWSSPWFDGMLHLTQRSGGQTANMAAPGFADDDLDWDSRALLAKLVWDRGTGNVLRLGMDGYEYDARSDNQSVLGRGRNRDTTLLQGDDESRRHRVSLEYSWLARDWLDSATARIYLASNRTRQDTREERATALTPIRRERRFDYQQDLAGLELTGVRAWSGTRAEHHLVAGLEYQHTATDEQRDGLQTNLLNGSQSNTVLGEVFPVRDFPESDTREWGLYVQDEIVLSQSRWTLVPAVRFDRYRLSPKPDAIYLEDNPQTPVVSLSESAVSPKLGVLYNVNEHWRLYGQYVRGFRAPPFEDANIGLDIALFKYRAIPNPGLRSETSDGFEIGTRRIADDSSFSLTVFYTAYSDFIESRARLGMDADTGYLLFQSRNIDDARIYGAEWRWQRALPESWFGIPGLTAATRLYWARGENETTHAPLNSINPPQAVTSLGWQSADQRIDLKLSNTLSAATRRVDNAGGTLFKPSGYGIVDLTGGFAISPRLNLRAGVFNLTDQKYWRWNDVRGFTDDDPVVEILSRPGRTWSLSLSGNF